METRSWSMAMTVMLVLLICCDTSSGQTADDGQKQTDWTPVTDPTSGEDGKAEQQSVRELTEEERMAQSLYEKALETLNDSKPDRASAFASLLQAAQLKHIPSQELVARAYLFGDDLPLDLEKAASMFKRLAGAGNPTAQLVSR